MSATPRIFLTSLGLVFKEAIYLLPGGTYRRKAELAPVALLPWLVEVKGWTPDRILALVTEGAANKTWPVLRRGLKETIGGPTPRRVAIADGESSEQVRQIVDTIADEIPSGCEMVLDVTQGFRHFPFLLYAVALYLRSLKEVRICGAYYGMLEGRGSEDHPAPILDLRPLLDLPDWFYAVRTFREAGSPVPMARLLELCSHGSKRPERSPETRLVRTLHELAFDYGSGLPLELGLTAEQVARVVGANLLPEELPLKDDLVQQVRASLGRFRLPGRPRKGEWKRSVVLDTEELRRQKKIIELCLERDQFPVAFGLMAEWLISLAIRAQNRAPGDPHWLDTQARQLARQRLNRLQAALKDKATTTLSPRQAALARVWESIRKARNALHHHGMEAKELKLAESRIRNARAAWQEQADDLLRAAPGLLAFGGGGGRLLVSPLGLLPGVLFSALRNTSPDRLLVLGSPETLKRLPEAAGRAGYTGPSKEIRIRDPHAGFGELKRIRSEASEALVNADEVLANLTGGTTLMGIAVQRIVEESQRLGRPTRRFALLDRRPHADQEADPWVASNFHGLDAETEAKDQGGAHADD